MTGDALLIASHGDQDDPRLPLVTRLGEAVLASASPWRVRRLAAGGPERDAPSRANVRRELDQMFDRPATSRLIVICAPVARTIEGLAMVCGADGGFREDASVSLEWFAKRLSRASIVPTAILLVMPDGDHHPRACLDVLGTRVSEHVIAVAAGDPLALLRIATDGLWSEASDLATGSVTPNSLGHYLGRRIPEAAVQPSASITTLLAPRGLARVDLAGRLPAGAEAGTDDLIGAVLPGQFRVTSELGRGNFGVVYRAHQEVVDREVALKVLTVQLGVEATRRFAQEIRAVGRLDHRNVVRVWHADVARDGRMFVAMELLEGPTLRELLSHGPVSPERALDLTHQLVAGLAAAHAAGVIHADVTPANAIVVEERVVLLDFGFAALRAEPSTAVGGTLAFMAPEQLRRERLEPGVDVYAAALVALSLVTGREVVAPAERPAALASFTEDRVRSILSRALHDDPSHRFADAGELLAELDGAPAARRVVRPPFRVAPFSEQDRDDFHGRALEIERLLEHVLFHRAVVYVAPSGTGKTSLLLAGLVPRLRDLEIDVAYVPCRTGLSASLAANLAPGAGPISEAIAQRLTTPTSRKLVLIVDQVEAALVSRDDAHGSAVLEGLDLSSWPLDTPIAVVWSVREEYLARLLERVRKVEAGVPIVRLEPLAPDTAAEVLRLTFERRGVAVDPALLALVIRDLAQAAARLATEYGWGEAPAVYPPHLQLAGSVLERARGGGPVDVALYRSVGGFSTILGEHLQQVLEGELAERETAIARDLLLALMTSSRAQVACEERDLVARAGGEGRSSEAIVTVLQVLRDRGLLVTLRRPEGEPIWDLAHDSLAAQIEAWITTTDLARRRAMDLIRYHLQRSSADQPSHLGVSELREVRAHLAGTDIMSLDAEWQDRLGVGPAPATRLLAASRRTIRFRRLALGIFVLAAIAVAGGFASRWLDGRRELTLRDRDIGETHLTLRAFDWDPRALVATDTTSASFSWELVRPSPDDPDLPGPRFTDEDLSRESLATPLGAIRSDRITARGGAAVLVIARRDRQARPCSQVIVPIRQLPGYDRSRELDLRIPTCEATASDMLPVPAGSFIVGGVGEPPSSLLQRSHSVERLTELPTFALDRTEVPNALLAVVAEAFAASDRRLPLYPSTPELAQSGAPDRPVAGLTWVESAFVCRLLGKRLPTSVEWQKALRGGLVLDDRANPFPRRTLPWGGIDLHGDEANLDRGEFSAPTTVGAHPRDLGPYGHLDLAGNVSEWTVTARADGFAVIRGGNWSETTPQTVVDFCAIDNPRPPKFSMYTIGFRCAELLQGQLEQHGSP